MTDVAGNHLNYFFHNPYEPNTTTFFQLNDDCILYIITYLPVLDLCNVRDTCQRLRSLTDYYFKRMHKSLNFGSRSIKNDTASWYTQEETKAILSSFGHQIEALTVNADYFSAKPEEVLKTINDHCDNSCLRHLKLIKFSFDDNILDNCPQLFSVLEKLTIDKCFVDDTFFEKLFKKCFSLQYLELIRQFNVDGTCLMHSYPTLRGFSLISNDNFDPLRVNSFFIKNPQLNVLKLIGCNFVDDEIFEIIADNLIELQRLSLRVVHVTSNFTENLMHLLRLQHLRELEFNCGVQKIDDFISGLAMTNRIQCLGISSVELNAELCNRICTLKNLEILKFIIIYDTEQSRSLKSIATQLPKLKELHLVECEPFTFAELTEFIENAPKLEKLVINQCCNIVPFDGQQFIQLAEACQRRTTKTFLSVHLDYEELVSTKQNVTIELRKEYMHILQLCNLSYEDTDHCVSDAQSRYFAEEDGAYDFDVDSYTDDDEDESEHDPYNVWNDDFDDEDLYPF